MPTLRDPWLDNAKFVLVAVVVVGHALVLLPSSEPRTLVYTFIYHWHIPVFVLITGYLSRSFTYSRRHLRGLLTTLAIPYVTFSFAMAYFREYVGGEPHLDPILTDPRWPMWYLICTLMWRLLTPLLKVHWVMVPLSILVSLWSGLYDFELFDISRMLGFLPFFVVGLHLSPTHAAALRTGRAWVLGALGLVAIWLLVVFQTRTWDHELLYFRTPYHLIEDTSFLEGCWLRLILMAVGFVGCASALALVPRREHFISAMGAASVVIYLFHGFFIRFAEYESYSSWMPSNGWAALAITVPLSVLLAMLLGWPPVANKLIWLVDPWNSWQKWRRGRSTSPAQPKPN